MSNISKIKLPNSETIYNIAPLWENVQNKPSLMTASEISSAISSAVKPIQSGTITMSTEWQGEGPYYQTVTVSGATITANSKVDLQPDSATILQLTNDGVAALYIANDNETLTAYALNATPTATLTVQCTITEITT